MSKRRWTLFGGGLIAAMVLLVGTSAASGAPQRPPSVPPFNHVFVIMMENTGIEALLNNPNAPWINQAVKTYGVAGNYYGVTHPSQPNYIAATAGTTAGVPDDNDVTVDLPNIVDQLRLPARGETVRRSASATSAYMSPWVTYPGSKSAAPLSSITT